MMCCVGDKVFARDVGWAFNCRLCAGRHGCGLLDGSVCIGQVKKRLVRISAAPGFFAGL